MDEQKHDENRLHNTAEIVAAYLSRNAVVPSDVPQLIASVHQALAKATNGPEPEPEPLQPPVPIKRSVTPDFIISLEDGKKYKSLRRHLSARGLSPDEYRAKWSLPADYPMVAPSYSAARSELAKKLGLGQLRSRQPEPEQKAAKKPTRARKKKADAA